METTYNDYTLDDFLQKRVPAYELYSVINDIGKAKVYQARTAIEGYLQDDDPELRKIALLVLGLYWRIPEHFVTAIDFLHHDPEELNRVFGAAIISQLKENTHDPHYLAMLAAVVRNTQETLSVRQTAYIGMLTIQGVDRMKRFEIARDFSLEKDVDWQLVDSYATEKQ